MREYELVYILQPDLTGARETEIHGKVEQFIGAADGQILLRDDWGKRKLAYEVEKFQKGHYFQLSFLGAGTAIPEIERSLRLDVDVLRYLTILADENVKDIQARVKLAEEQKADQQRRREEREAAEAEREQAATEARALDSADASVGDRSSREKDENEKPAALKAADTPEPETPGDAAKPEAAAAAVDEE